MYKSRYSKIKLIFPCWFDIYDPFTFIYPYPYLPYGMGVLTAFLREHGYSVDQDNLSVRFNQYVNSFFPLKYRNKNFDLNKNIEKISWFLNLSEKDERFGIFISEILNSTPIKNFDMIGFSIHSYPHFMFALMLSKKIRQMTNTPIVFGGPFITLFHNLYPEALNIVNYLIIGDGRIPLLRLIDYLNNRISLKEVPNLIYKADNKLIATPNYSYSIEDIPMPDFSDFSLELYKNKDSYLSRHIVKLPYQISRGCAGSCSFCDIKHMHNKVEFKSYDKIIRELRQMREIYNSHIFDFSDEALNNSYEFLEKLCNLFVINRLNINWNIYVKAINLDRYILNKMKKAGCHWLIFGIESGSDSILKFMNKGFTIKEASQILKDAAEVGLCNSICLIAGYPRERREDIKRTINFIRKNKRFIHTIQVFKFELIYNSLIYQNPEKYEVTNLQPINKLQHVFSFDEVNGLKWEQKKKQQELSLKQIVETVRKDVKSKVLV